MCKEKITRRFGGSRILQVTSLYFNLLQKRLLHHFFSLMWQIQVPCLFCAWFFFQEFICLQWTAQENWQKKGFLSWCLLIFTLNINSKHYTTKINLLECVKMRCNMLRQGLLCLKMLSSEPNEHLIAHLKLFNCDITVNILVYIVWNLGWLWTSMLQRNFKIMCNQNDIEDTE